MFAKRCRAVSRHIMRGAMLACALALRRVGRDITTYSPRFAAYVIGSVSAYWVFERALAVV